MKTFWRVIYIAAVLVVTIALISIFSSDPNSSEGSSGSVTAQFSTPEQVGYFKADNNNRVFTYRIDRRMQESAIRSHADSRMHTTGRITYVFYYFNDVPNPTTASNLDRALQITESSDFKYSFMKMGNGQATFTAH